MNHSIFVLSKKKDVLSIFVQTNISGVLNCRHDAVCYSVPCETSRDMEEAFRKFSPKSNGASKEDLINWCKEADVLGKHLTVAHLEKSYSHVRPKGAK